MPTLFTALCCVILGTYPTTGESIAFFRFATFWNVCFVMRPFSLVVFHERTCWFVLTFMGSMQLKMLQL